MIDINDIDTVSTATAVDRDGAKIGKVGQVYISEDGRQPLFVTVNTGFFGTKSSFVPLQGASLADGQLRLQYDKDTVKGAPSVEDDGALTDDEQGTIYDYYDGRAGGSPSGVGATSTGLPDSPSDADDHEVSDTTGSAGYDTSGPTTDDAMTRSEERLRVGVQQVETGRARLRKHVVTEQQTVTVPVSHDEVRIEREPITDANRGAAESGPVLSEEEHEVVLTEERPVVAKETVPVERVRLGTERVTEDRQVTEDVRHEEIETVQDGTAGR